ncbi:MAG: T9SS type A sorting domain-containing protein [Flavobacteriales bacterium]|nr:T9SS type A sorting domain-containing protein [Flavobacteriales bacterium]
MMTRYAFLALAAFATPAVQAQVFLSDTLLETYTAQELVALGVGNAQYGVEVYRITYNTIDPFGGPTIASGALVLPLSQNCYHPLASYMHGTILNRNDVPSRLSGEIIVGYFLGGTGYVAALPDYLGLGDSPGPHPYIHAASEASATIDMLRATREFCALRGVQLNGQLFLMGYSQGGHACMATHKVLQEQYPDEFTVTASGPLSGPHDVSGVQAEAMVTPDPYPAPYYLPYVIFSFGYVYPGIYNDISEVFKEPWATILPPLFQGNNGSGAVDAVMPAAPSQILVDSVLEAFSSDPEHYFRVALRDNDLYDWRPDAPVRMMYCESDSHVFYENSLVALAAMQANGAPNVQALSAGAGLEHGDCAFPALLSTKIWFDSQKGPCDWNGIDERTSNLFSAFPNPASDHLRITASDGLGHRVVWSLFQADGRLVADGNLVLSYGDGIIALPAAPAGLYVLQLQGAAGKQAIRVVLE